MTAAEERGGTLSLEVEIVGGISETSVDLSPGVTVLDAGGCDCE